MGFSLGAMLSGIGLLIFAYLLFSNGDRPLALLNGTFSGSTSTIKALQGR